ncbi:PRC-barrel domain-containing protein [Ferrovibrio terrae]|nr:PRC-barrel domain-containing protein [Ferrovibrio terrae]
MKARLIATAAVISLGLGGAAFAQTDPSRSPTSTPPGAGTPPAASDQTTPSTGSPGMGSGTTNMPGSSTMTTAPAGTGGGMGGGAMAGVDARELLGADLKNAQNEKIGEVQAVQLDSAGKVRSLIVGVGGVLGLGARAVAVEPSALSVADGGDTVRTTLTKDQLKAMPEYEYSDKSYRGEVFSDSGVVKK